jgi:thiamine-monophosphate kinase
MSPLRLNHEPRQCRPRAARAKKLSEFERIARISALFATRIHSQVKVGIGDDAAVLRRGKGDLVWTVDSSVEGVHFRRDWLKDQDIGWRSFHAAVSDLAAMGAKPIGALSALELPKDYDERSLMRLLQGQKDAANALGCPIIGGNLASAASVAVTTTVLGQTTHALLRSGARVDDELWLVGELGLAAAGLACLMDASRKPWGSAVERCVAAWRRPEALIRRGRALLGRAHAAIDISDGLVGDAEHIAESSRVAVELNVDVLADLLRPELRNVAEQLSLSAIEFALHGGEDYALLATGPRSRRPRWASPIGRVVAGRGVWGTSREKGRQRLRSGFDHFRS